MRKNIDTLSLSEPAKIAARKHVELPSERRPRVMRTLEVRGRLLPNRESKQKQEQERTTERQKHVEKIITGKYKKERTAALKNETWGHKFENFFETLHNTRSGRIAKHTIEALVAGTMIVGGTVTSGPLAFLAAPALSIYGTALLARTGIRSLLMAGKEWNAMKVYEETRSGKGRGGATPFIRLEASVDSRVRGLRNELNSGKITKEQFQKKVLDFVRAKQVAEQRLSRAAVDLKKIQSKHNLIATIASLLVTGGLIAKGGLELIPGLKLGGLSFGMHDVDLDGISHQIVFQEGVVGFVRNMTERMVDGHTLGALGKAVALSPEAFAGLASALFVGVAGFTGDMLSKIRGKSPKVLEKTAKILVQNAKLTAWKEIEWRDKEKIQRRKNIHPLGNTREKKSKVSKELEEIKPVKAENKQGGTELFEKEFKQVDVLRGVIAAKGGFGNEESHMGPVEFWERFEDWNETVAKEQREEFKTFVEKLNEYYVQYAHKKKIPMQYDDRSRLLDTILFRLKHEPQERKQESREHTEIPFQSFDENDFNTTRTPLAVRNEIISRLGFDGTELKTLGEKITGFNNFLTAITETQQGNKKLKNFFEDSVAACKNSSLSEKEQKAILEIFRDLQTNTFGSEQSTHGGSRFKAFSPDELQKFTNPNNEGLFYQDVMNRCGISFQKEKSAKTELERWLQNASSEDQKQFQEFLLTSQKALEQLEKSGEKTTSEQKILLETLANFYEYGMIV